MRELEEDTKSMEEVKRKIEEEEWSEERKKMKEVVAQKMRAVWGMKERAGEEEKEEIEVKQHHPLRLALIGKLEKLADSVEGRMEEEVSEFRKSIVEIVESVGFEEVAERAGLSEMKKYREVRKLKEECSTKM